MKLITTLSLLILGFAATAQYNFHEIEIWSGSFPGTPRYFTEVNGTLFFEAYNNYNYELWKSNGTQAGTSLVADLNGTASSGPKSLAAFNGELIFTATVSGMGHELWKSDGTSAGTVMLKDVWPGSSSGFASTTSTFNGDRETFLEFGGELFFFGNAGNGIELWKTDGTPTGTVSVKNFTVGPIYGNGKYSSNGEREKLGVIFNNELYFLVEKSSPVPSEFRGELWKTDGTTAGTVLVKDSLDVNINALTVANNRVYFTNSSSAFGDELWSSDGTTAGTGIAADIDPGTNNGNPEYLTPYAGELYFKAHGPNGRELYKTNGLTTTLVKDINVGNSSSLNLARFFEYNGLLYFLANDGTTGSNELWQSDGTNSGTVKALTITEVGGYIEFLNPIIYDNKIFYRTSTQLWVTDGTPANTQQLTDNGNSAEPISQVSHLALFQQNLWFAGANATNGVEAWYIGNEPPTTLDVTTCGSYTVPSGDESYSNSGTYADTLTNSQGGDSLLVINLTVNQPTMSTIDASTCDTYTSPSGNSIWTTSGTYQDTLTNSVGCDSIITINLSVLSTSSNIAETACNAYNSPSGNYIWLTSGTYIDTVPNAAGCDSVIIINLTINTVDLGVQENSGTLFADASSASYQWLDCDNNYAMISGEINQSFTPSQTGNYAVEITDGTCVDTSDCYPVNVNEVLDLSQSTISVYPNPTSGKISIENPAFDHSDRIRIMNTLGQVVYDEHVQNSMMSIELPVSAGIYILTYETQTQEFYTRIVKK